MCPRGRRRTLASSILIGVLLLPVPAMAQGDPDVVSVPDIAFDLVILRPVGLLATFTGVGMFPIAAVLAAPGGLDSIAEAWDHFVVVPTKNVFTRPLGEF